MPSREPELYKDKVEVSLDGRQIFYLFFGGAMVVGIVFVLGVLVGRRVEARGHIDRARTTTATDPLAALDRLEGTSGGLAFRGALTGKDAPTDVDKTIDQLEKARTKPDGKKPDGKVAEVKTDAKAETKTDPKIDPKAATKVDPKVAAKTEGKTDAKPDGKTDAKPEGKADAKPEGKTDAKAAAKTEEVEAKADSQSKPVTKPDTRPEAKPVTKPAAGELEAKAEKPVTKPEEPKQRFTLQLSSFQDRGEAEAFLDTIKAKGYSAQITQAEVEGKGTFYRVRMGNYRSLEAASTAKADFEKASSKSASIMKL
jgi:cell division protein FtsN